MAGAPTVPPRKPIRSAESELVMLSQAQSSRDRWKHMDRNQDELWLHSLSTGKVQNTKYLDAEEELDEIILSEKGR